MAQRGPKRANYIFASFPEHFHVLFHLRYAVPFSTVQIAYVRDIPESAVKPPPLQRLAAQLRPALRLFQPRAAQLGRPPLDSATDVWPPPAVQDTSENIGFGGGGGGGRYTLFVIGMIDGGVAISHVLICMMGTAHGHCPVALPRGTAHGHCP